MSDKSKEKPPQQPAPKPAEKPLPPPPKPEWIEESYGDPDVRKLVRDGS